MKVTFIPAHGHPWPAQAVEAALDKHGTPLGSFASDGTFTPAPRPSAPGGVAALTADHLALIAAHARLLATRHYMNRMACIHD